MMVLPVGFFTALRGTHQPETFPHTHERM